MKAPYKPDAGNRLVACGRVLHQGVLE
jgi:hypothetical protein